MSNFVLVHGSFHGAWCWDGVEAALGRAGHRVVAVDLPGHGSDVTPVPGRTLKSYADTVTAAIDAMDGPVVLVGHSMGGVIVTAAAELRPERLARLVYLCAFLPRDGQCLLDLAKTDADSLILPNLVIDEAAGVHWVRPESHVAVFYADCTAEVAKASSARLVPEALAPVATPVHITPERFGRVPRTYVFARHDACLSPALQHRMVEATPCDTLAIETSHSPMLARPEETATVLAQAAAGG